MTANICPATTTVPMRAGPGLGATLSVTVPLPLPLPPEETVIQSALLTAVRVQPFAPVTLIVTVPPALPIAWLVGLSVKVQGFSFSNAPMSIVPPTMRAKPR